MNKQKYTLANPPSFDEPGFVIEQHFLRHIKTGEIPDLEKYLQKFNHFDWAGLLMNNPRKIFIKYLTDEMIQQIDWRFIMNYLAAN